MPPEMQWGAFGLLLLVLGAGGKLGHLFVMRTLDNFTKVTDAFEKANEKAREVFSATIEKVNERHTEDHNRMLDMMGNLSARIESGRCVQRPSTGTMQAIPYPGPERHGKLPSRPDR